MSILYVKKCRDSEKVVITSRISQNKITLNVFRLIQGHRIEINMSIGRTLRKKTPTSDFFV